MQGGGGWTPVTGGSARSKEGHMQSREVEQAGGGVRTPRWLRAYLVAPVPSAGFRRHSWHQAALMASGGLLVEVAT